MTELRLIYCKHQYSTHVMKGDKYAGCKHSISGKVNLYTDGYKKIIIIIIYFLLFISLRCAAGAKVGECQETSSQKMLGSH